MTRNVMVVIGAALLSVGGIGIIVGLVWLTATKINPAIPPIFDEGAETLLYMLPALLLVVAVIGAGFVATALAIPMKEERTTRLRLHTHLHR